MKSKDWLIIVFCLILSGVLLTAASTRMESIHQAREDMGLVANTSLEMRRRHWLSRRWPWEHFAV